MQGSDFKFGWRPNPPAPAGYGLVTTAAVTGAQGGVGKTGEELAAPVVAARQLGIFH